MPCTALRSVARTAEGQRNAGLGAGKRIVILGAGFGGIAAAVELARLLPQAENGDIVVYRRRQLLAVHADVDRGGCGRDQRPSYCGRRS